MFPSPTDPPCGSAGFAPVEITAHPDLGDAEALIESVRHRGGGVEVTLVLGDGECGESLLTLEDWNWLELASGDIVPVRPLGSARISA
jgi:hypothetical protein